VIDLRIVIKIGGDLVRGEFPPELLSDIKGVAGSNQVVLVHGGGDIVTEIATKLGKEQRFIISPEGVRSRYTDRETVDIYTMVMSGLIAKKLVLTLAKEGIPAVSVSGLDGSLLRATRKKKLIIIDERGRKVAIEGGFTGKMRSIEPGVVEALLSRSFIPIVSPVAVGDESEPLNVDSDRAATYLATGLVAEAVLFITDVKGLLLDDKLVDHLSPEVAKSSLHKIGFGMQKKVLAGIEAVEGGVKEAIICTGFRTEPITKALKHEECTVISR
jgi:acetylglutamate/LysW-gamma-L-alpha-aminoadipate kinase